ncbi:MAG: nitrile hydratase accessory protein [Actinomycetota bacterium]
MTDAGDPLDADGPAAPPRSNGELVFTEPWQSRLFGTTMRLFEAEHFEWDRFRDRLIAEIEIHQAAIGRDPGIVYDYWGCWQRALEGLLDELALVPDAELAATAEAFAARPAGHDHDDHDHDGDRSPEHDGR